MQQSAAESNIPRPLVDTPTVCPLCWDHDITQVEHVRLSAHSGDGHDVGRAYVYRCSRWHLFALFDQP
jgi:hypothetical protein